MTNAKNEFIDHIRGYKVLCATIQIVNDYSSESPVISTLKKGYNKEEYNAFLESINKEYDSEYGGQELFGTIWFTDGTWSTRGEYDGSEWWQIHKRPNIPNELKTSK